MAQQQNDSGEAGRLEGRRNVNREFSVTLPFPQKAPAGFRWKLLIAMMCVVASVTGIAIYVAQRNLAAEASNSLRREFQEKLASLHNVQEIRHAVLTERCRALVRKPRIHAALEDNALDLLYPSAQDELRDILTTVQSSGNGIAQALQAEFYRFLDAHGAVLSPSDAEAVGALSAGDESRLSVSTVPRAQQLGYLPRKDATVSEVIAVPIFSSETGEPIAALALGFKPLEFSDGGNGIRNGIEVGGRLYFPALNAESRETLQRQIAVALAGPEEKNSFRLQLGAVPHLVFYSRLNSGSLYPAAYEVCVFPLTDLLARQEKVRWRILSAGVIMLLAGFAASHYFSGKLSVPVEKLAVDSERHRTGKEKAEAALEQTSVELQRSARFSADASHQLKTPVTVMRAGLEELMAREDLSPELRQEIDNLIHQSFRLTGVVDDLLLLSRMDAGRLRLDLAPVDLSLLIAGELDDLTAQPNPQNISVQCNLPPDVLIQGERRYTTMILRNLLENARKYNRANGHIRVSAKIDADGIELSVANTGQSIPSAVQERIFDRFHRGAMGENVPGHGLGLNLARELARLHGGDLWLAHSDRNETEFVVRFRLARALVGI
jgi:signal transduction histidine kinase